MPVGGLCSYAAQLTATLLGIVRPAPSYDAIDMTEYLKYSVVVESEQERE
jgi:hypothetical protein